MSDEKTEQQPAVGLQLLQEQQRLMRELFEQKTRQNIDHVYSNSLHFENGDLDFKILFGQVTELASRSTVDWRTEVTMPWALARLLAYYMQVNIKIFETEKG